MKRIKKPRSSFTQGVVDVATGRAALEGVKVIGRRIFNPELTPQQKKNQASFERYTKSRKKR